MFIQHINTTILKQNNILISNYYFPNSKLKLLTDLLLLFINTTHNFNNITIKQLFVISCKSVAYFVLFKTHQSSKVTSELIKRKFSATLAYKYIVALNDG